MATRSINHPLITRLLQSREEDMESCCNFSYHFLVEFEFEFLTQLDSGGDNATETLGQIGDMRVHKHTKLAAQINNFHSAIEENTYWWRQCYRNPRTDWRHACPQTCRQPPALHTFFPNLPTPPLPSSSSHAVQPAPSPLSQICNLPYPPPSTRIVPPHTFPAPQTRHPPSPYHLTSN